MTEDPATTRFPTQAGRITELMRSNEEFASICRDYAEIVADIAHEEQAFGRSASLLTELVHLKLDLENEILERIAAAT